MRRGRRGYNFKTPWRRQNDPTQVILMQRMFWNLIVGFLWIMLDSFSTITIIILFNGWPWMLHLLDVHSIFQLDMPEENGILDYGCFWVEVIWHTNVDVWPNPIMTTSLHLNVIVDYSGWIFTIFWKSMTFKD